MPEWTKVQDAMLTAAEAVLSVALPVVELAADVAAAVLPFVVW